MSLPILNSRSRIMMFAPHPDDESLAAGVFVQRAIAAGAAVRIVYATDGEKNCWPQRVLERKVRIREDDRRRWGARRRSEALAALRVLNIESDNVEFLSLPDQGLTDLLLEGCPETMRRLAATIIAWQPTHLLLPSVSDTHPDHSALAVMLGLVFDDCLALPNEIARLHYLVHGASASFTGHAWHLPQTALERKTKRRAIVRHISQVALSRRRFLAYANRLERFVCGDPNIMRAGDGAIRSFGRARGELRLQVAFSLKPLRAEETSLYLLGRDRLGELRSFRAILPGRCARLDLVDCATGAIGSAGWYHGDAFRAEILLPLDGFAASRSLYVKLNRRVWFFDEAGWHEIGALLPGSKRLPAREVAFRELAVA
jgi:LmbE family N-acetylglucosaminyl deacetylase